MKELENDRILRAIARALEGEVRLVIEEEAEKAAEATRERVRQKVGTLVTGLLSQYRVFLQGRDELHIVVKIEGLDDGQNDR